MALGAWVVDLPVLAVVETGTRAVLRLRAVTPLSSTPKATVHSPRPPPGDTVSVSPLLVRRVPPGDKAPRKARSMVGAGASISKFSAV